MKLNSILGCALVAGLMAFAAEKTQAANLVVSNEVYAPFNLKLTASYVNGNKITTASITTKQYLKDRGFNSNVSLMVNTGTREIWLVNSGTLVSNLSSTLQIGLSFIIQAQPSEKKQSYDQAGTFSVSSSAADNFFVSGTYTRKYSRSTTDKNGNFTYSDDLKSSNLTGSGNFVGLSEEDVPVSGSADYKGSGKLVD